ncbi:MAG: hypothetical protein D6703_02375 [Zetaproteobacteria bacterium]|nr:MAG: hypothetical protein D6703_02375 [Zetaproteobacteria bacterium]
MLSLRCVRKNNAIINPEAKEDGSMKNVDKMIREYLDAVEAAQGKEARENIKVRWTGGTHVVIHNAANDEKRLVDIGSLRTMTQYLRKAA